MIIDDQALLVFAYPDIVDIGDFGAGLFGQTGRNRLPDRIVLPMYPVLAAVLGLLGILSGQWPVGRALGGAALWLVAIGSVWLVSAGRAMGFGDVKLAPLLGMTLAWIRWDAALLRRRRV